MPNTYFQFKQFTIHHDRCAMKVGTDGVLVGSWASHPNPKQVLDIGTGSGLIALMLAQRFPKSKITGIEIDKEAANQASENIASSEFKNQISIKHLSLQEYQPTSEFDLIVCNPPFFKVTSKSQVPERNLARQLEKLDLSDIFSFSSRWLNADGKLVLIFPSEHDLEELALQHGFYAHKKLVIKGNELAASKRVLWQFGRNAETTTSEILILESARNQYTPAFKELINNFYLHV